MRTFLLLLPILFVGCTKQYTAVYPKDPVYKEEEADLLVFEEKGEKYTRRGDLTLDITRFRPDEGESYDRYRERIFNTLLAQELEIQSLRGAIKEKGDSVSSLRAQLLPMKEQQAEMRLALSSESGVEGFASQQPSNRKIRFHRRMVEKGDTLQRIAHEEYGTYTGWIALYRFNHSRLPYGPNRIEVGTTLLVPELSDLQSLPTLGPS